MADREHVDASAASLSEVRATLLRVAHRLSSLEEASSPSVIATSPTEFRRADATSSSNVVSTAAAAAAEQRRLFTFGRQAAGHNRKNKGKGKKSPTCTLKFVCLQSKGATKPPLSVGEKTALCNYGLGDGSITFEINEGSDYCHRKILEKYPKLAMAGGYELLLHQRGSGDDAGFHPIKPPYTPLRLKDFSGQAKIYIRPLQKDLAIECEEQAVEETANPGPVIQCFTCGALVAMSTLRQHQEIHLENPPAAKRQRTLDRHIIESVQSVPDIGGTSQPSEMPGTSGISQPPEWPSTSGVSQPSEWPGTSGISQLSGWPGTSGTSQPSDLPGSIGSSSVHALQEICPSASLLDIQSALAVCNGDADEAAQKLLATSGSDSCSLDTVDLGGKESTVKSADYKNWTPAIALQHFQQEVIAQDQPAQRISVSRMDGTTELQADIIGIYKNPKTKLTANPRVRFEGEDGVGCGPVREFFVNAVRIIEEGIHSSDKALVFLEGEADHRLPVHDQSLRLTGTFKALGRIIGHSVLHGGPGLHGLSPAAKHYLSTERSDDDHQPPPIELADIADIELRNLISELDVMPKEEHPSPELRCSIEPYLFEAGLDLDNLYGNRKLLLEGLMVYHVIEKRHFELDDLARGMDEVSLTTFLRRTPSLIKVVFPREAERVILADEVKELMTFEDRSENEQNGRTAEFYESYIDELEVGIKGGPQMEDLISFWTGARNLPTGKDSVLLVTFDDGSNLLPLAETCFKTLILPIKHTCYEDFQKNMNIALNFGAKGFSFT